MKNYLEPLIPDKYYHIYNHAVGRDNLFKNDDNYNFFLTKYAQHVSSIVDTFAYCLMPNHFHLAVRIKPQKEIETIMRTFPKFKTLEKLDVEKFVSKQFSNLFSSYTQSFNKQQNRRGSLFEKPFKRKLIDSDEYFRNMIHYIHFNPVHHHFVDNLHDWKHSSFASFFSKNETLLKRELVIEWFGNTNNFNAYHQKEIKKQMIIDLES